MKKTFVLLSVLCTLFTNASFAQVINGDLNHNENLDVEDITLLIGGYLTGDAEVINTDPFEVDNNRVVGTWYKSPTESVTFYADGTTDYVSGCTYKYLPWQGYIQFYNSDGIPQYSARVTEVTNDYLCILPAGSDVPVVYTAKHPVTITLSPTNYRISKSVLSARLTATVAPSDAGPVTWTSSDESIVAATVSSSSDRICYLRGVGIGTAEVTAEVEGVTATCTVNVYDPNSVLVTDITLSQSTLTLEVGQSSGVMTTVSPSNASKKTLIWTSSNPDVATVSSSGNTEGVIKATGVGTATITCAATDGSGVTATCQVTVNPILVKDITLSQPTLTLELGQTRYISAEISPSDATNNKVRWSSSDESVATVGDGNGGGYVKAKGVGTATITCSATDGSGVTATCQVTVPSVTTTYTVNGITFRMVSVTGGTFKMGAQSVDSSLPNYDADARDNESPVHDVTLSDYCIGETEVTQGLWYAVMGYNPSFKYIGDDLPVDGAGWGRCQEFIEKLNELTGETFRLPTEAEWEFAARGGTMSHGYKYSGSNNIDDVAWYEGDAYGIRIHEVATKQPNELGIYDMTGNAYEWCQDWYGEYSSAAQVNPTGSASATGTRRVIRGGLWYSFALKDFRTTVRYGHVTTESPGTTGFRLAK